MKKLLLTLILILSFIGIKAQNFYNFEDVDFVWHQGTLEDAGLGSSDYRSITPFASPMATEIGASSSTICQPMVTISLLNSNKFLCLTFTQKHYYTEPYDMKKYIEIHYTENDMYSGGNKIIDNAMYPGLKNLMDQPWLDFDFTDIRFYETYNCITIPCTYGYPQNNYLIIWLDKDNAVNSLPEGSGKSAYYDLNGLPADPEHSSGEILVKKSGKETEKKLIRNAR